MKPESPFLNAIVLSPFSRRCRAERSPGWWYHYVDIALCSAALRSMYDCVVIASVKNTKLSPQKLAEAHHFFYLPPFLEKQKENSGAKNIFDTALRIPQSALQFFNDLFTEPPHLVTSSFFPIMCIVHGCSSDMRLCDHKTTVLWVKQQDSFDKFEIGIHCRTFYYLHWLVYKVDHTWELQTGATWNVRLIKDQ